MANASISKNKTAFTEYPPEADNFFHTNEILTYKIPFSIHQDIESTNTVVHFTSAKQYIDYLQSEIAFWEVHDPEKN